MLSVHLSDGRTLRFDLSNEEQAAAWLKHVQDYKFQAEISGLTVQHNSVQYSVPRPLGFKKIWLFAEVLPADLEQKFKGGERIVCQADNVRTVVMIHDAQRAARVGLTKTGRVVYNPLERRIPSGPAEDRP